ncbi:16S rRNA (guanine966-N2)-methyltransferase [Modicisalibacter muralis]|uniref:Ribosomal RNA small subunit methyltransferase D n=1 Tax=Modicisalibacter muralis TaxID=119000 RepID=A0A1G9Q8M9_9GAMM|nr:16S rRNA (guanine(966)-N(2))-methyltransferase RsmD [Halomonas muralis]SDM06705.1 16S rRNA (guanine966-N2)-methyltransferase [Halomonas muralis]
MNRRRSSPSRRSAAPTGKGSGKLRIIGGEFRRRQLAVPDSPGLRPTPDRVRETLFNWLAFELAGCRVLDLFAGTGALGFEALSRGAAHAHFVEANPAVARAIDTNLATLGATGQVTVRDASGFLSGAAAPFDIVFLDPPFRQGLAAPACELLENRGWLADEARVYVETEAELVPKVPTNWSLYREVRAGDSHGRLYRRIASPPGDAC